MKPEGPDEPRRGRAGSEEFGEIIGRLVAVELDHSEADPGGDLGDLGDGTVDEQADGLDRVGEGGGDLAGAFDREGARRRRVEVEADPVGPGLDAGQGRRGDRSARKP